MSSSMQLNPVSAGVFPQFLDGLIERAAQVPGSRPGSAFQDLVLSIELTFLFLLWLREFPRVNLHARPLFFAYATNLLCAAMWCGLGVYIHLLEPLPRERTPTWLAFLGLGAATPLLFPLVAFFAFAKDALPTTRPGPYIAAGMTGVAYMLAVATAADLSLGGVMPTELLLTPWHAVDGRSYGGQEHGIVFDLLTSYPCYRGDSMFVLSTLFLVSNALSVYILHCFTHHTNKALVPIAGRLRLGISVMFVNCISILYFLVVLGMSVSRVFDVFHAIQGLVMAAAFFDFRSALRIHMQHAKSA